MIKIVFFLNMNLNNFGNTQAAQNMVKDQESLTLNRTFTSFGGH
jgi:hypothetical protein